MKPPSILVIDNEPVNLMLMSNYLDKHACDVITALNGEEGIRLARLEQPRLILLDIMMPGINGFETCRLLKTDPETQDIPVIFMTALVSVEDKVRGFNAGGVDYITKPVQQKELLARVDIHITLRNLRESLEVKNQQLQSEILERKQAEEKAWLARLEAETANRAKSAFLAGISHELRTPLNGILGYAQIFSQDSELSGKYQEGIRVIKESGEYLLALIDDILDLSRLESEKLVLHPDNILLANVLENIIGVIRMRAEQKGIGFHWQKGDNLPVAVYADGTRLRQILLNLLENAVKFTEQGQVEFSVENVAGKQLLFCVKDTGSGIPEKDRDLIFQAFQQAGDDRHRAQGAGLGLAICKRLVELMDGSINLESEPGEGSLFQVCIPFQSVTEQLAAGKQHIGYEEVCGYKGRRRKLLVVDDHREDGLILSGFLRPLGFEITQASGYEESLRIAASLKPDAILLDLIMFSTSGFEIMRAIRADSRLQDTPIIGISANAAKSMRKRTIEAGFNDFIPKPVDFSLLLKRLHEHLGIQWISKKRTSLENTPKAADIYAAPIQEKVDELYHLARIGDVMGVADKATEFLNAGEEGLRPFYEQILRLASDFQINRIIEFLKPYGSEEKS